MSLGSAGVVVAGIDASAAARGAARWAAFEANRRGARLRLVHAMTPTSESGYLEPFLIAPRVSDRARARAVRMLATVAGMLTEEQPDLRVETAHPEGSPWAVLVDESRKAILTVVGSHGDGQPANGIFGSVAARLASHGDGCVVVVPTGTAPDPPSPTAPVMVGVDGSASADPAIGFAFEQASSLGAVLLVVHVWNDKPLEHALGRYPMEINVSNVDDQERRILGEQMVPWAEKYPEVDLQLVILRGHAAPSLRSHAVRVSPRLIVVGNRGRGGLASLVLGSTSMAMLGYADCPVAVVRGAGGMSPASVAEGAGNSTDGHSTNTPASS